MESLLRTGLFLVLGGTLILANLWFIQAVRDNFLSRGIAIASFDVVGGNGDPELGRTLATLLQARLRQVQADLQRAQERLTRAPNDFAPPAITPGLSQSDKDEKLPPPMPVLWAEPVNLNTALFEPVDIKINVGGVEVGRLVPWIQRALVKSHSLHFTVSYEKEKTIIVGNISSLDAPLESIWIETDAATPAKIADLIAHELILQKLASDRRNRFGVLDRQEFQTLATILCETARLNDKISRGRPVVHREFALLLPDLETLVEKVPEWSELLFLAGIIAENADDRNKAILFYARLDRLLSAQDGSPEDGQRRTLVTSKIKELRTALPHEFFKGLGQRIVAFTGLFEFGSDSPEHLFATVARTPNNDIRFGVAGWNFSTGTLGPLLRQFQQTDPLRFQEILGDGMSRIEAVLAGSREDGLAFAHDILENGGRLREPWASRFTALGCEQKFQEVQMRTLEPYFKRAVALADKNGLRSERGLALCFNIVFHLGTGPVLKKAEKDLDAFTAEFVQEHNRQPGEAERLSFMANAISKNLSKRFPQISHLSARYDLLAKGSGIAPGAGAIDMETRGIRLVDFRTGQPLAEPMTN